MRTFSTVAGLFRQVCETHGNAGGLFYRTAAGWTCVSTLDIHRQVLNLSAWLKSIGVNKGDTVGLLAMPSPHWMITDLSIMLLGAVSVPFFPVEPDEIVKFKIEDAKIKRLFMFHPESWPTLRRHAASLDTLITHSTTLTFNKAITFDSAQEQGAKLLRIQPALADDLGRDVTENNIATIIYTSGSTGIPKGVELTHKNLISQVHAAQTNFNFGPADRAVSCLPLAHSFERMILYYYFASGIPVYFNSDIKKLGEDLRDVKPTIMTVVPRILEKVHDKILSRIEQASLPTRALGRWALALAEKRHPEDGKSLPDAIADRLVYARLRDSLGGCLRCVITGGAALPLPLYRFYLNIGLPLYQGYGMTEMSPVISTNCPGACKTGTVGRPFPGVEAKISTSGELLARGPNLMRGYHNQPKASADIIDAEGWIHTGDLATIDPDGYVTITGRAKELFKTLAGEYVSPAPLEDALRASPLIDSAMVIGEGRDFVSCLLFTDPHRLALWKAHAGQNGTDDKAFLESPYVRQLVEALLRGINLRLEHWAQIKDYRFIATPVSVETGELTPTMKLRRHVILEKYRPVIEEIYKQKKMAD